MFLRKVGNHVKDHVESQQGGPEMTNCDVTDEALYEDLQ
jgi:hypothetical protein